jgi:DNA-binding MarR family transcriptional regulator
MQARTIYLVKRVETEVTSAMSNALSAFDITPLQYSVMSFVEIEGENFSSAQLSRRFLMTPQSMNETVTILQRKNMLVKTTDPNHKRVLLLNLTEQGKAVLATCNEAINAIETQLFSGLKEKELTHYRNLMGKILKNTRAKQL